MKTFKTDFHLGLTDLLLVVTAVVGIILSSYFLWNDKYLNQWLQISAVSSEQKMGLLTDLKNDVRRKLGTSFMWFDVKDAIEVYKGDSVFTGDNSEAQVQFDDGLILSLASNSLIVIEEQGDEFVLDLKAGQVVAKRVKQKNILNIKNQTSPGKASRKSLPEKKFTLVQNGKKAEVRVAVNKTLQLTKTDLGKLRLSSNTGGVEVLIDGQKNQINTGERLKLDTEFKIEKFPIELLAPLSGIKILQEESADVSFSWETEIPKETQPEFELVMAKDPKMKNVVFETKTKMQMYKFKGILPVGEKLYWQVTAFVNESSKKSSIESFVVYENRAPQLRSPENKSIINFAVEEVIPIRFQWTQVLGADEYQVQIATDINFLTVIDEMISEDNQLKGYKPLQGEYYWRVRALWREPNKYLKFSRPYSYQVMINSSSGLKTPPVALPTVESPPDGIQGAVESAQEVLQKSAEMEKNSIEQLAKEIKPPTLKIPTKELELDFGSFKGGSDLQAKKSLKSKLTVRWENQEKASLYKMQISRDKNFKDLVVDKNLKGNTFDWTSVEPGQFYYRVAALSDPLERVKKFSEPLPLNIKLPAPRLKGKQKQVQKFSTFKDLDSAESKINVYWNKVPLAKHYKIKLNGEVLGELLNKNKATVSLGKKDNGKVQVVAVDKLGKEISEFSNEQIIKLEKRLELMIPKLLVPMDEVSIVSFGEEENEIIFTWSKVPDALTYTIQISEDEDFKKVVVEENISTRSYTYDKALKKGERYFWRVKALRDKYQSKWSSPRVFDL